MPYQDLRAFLSTLRAAGDLVEIARPIALKYDVAKALAKSSSVDGPALMFKQTGTDFPLVAGLYGNRRRALIAFEAFEMFAAKHWQSVLDARREFDSRDDSEPVALLRASGG